MNREQIIYRKINLIFAGIMICIFIYSGIFAYIPQQPFIPSFHKLLTGESSLSTGLTRSFMAIMRFDFKLARYFNPHGPAIFLFFFLQLCMRLFLYSFIPKNFYTVKEILTLDLILSIGMFLFFFEPFIRYTFNY